VPVTLLTYSSVTNRARLKVYLGPIIRGRGLRSPTVSEPRPKRARLCEEDESLELPASRSRFFGAASDPSPTVGKSSRRRGKKDDITIFSDDSVEEALLSLPDFDGFGDSGKKKIAIFEEVDNSKFNSLDRCFIAFEIILQYNPS